MKIDVIGASLTWESKQIIKALKKRNIETQFIDPKHISYEISQKIKIYYKNKKYKIPNIVFCRGGFTGGIRSSGRMFVNLMKLLNVKTCDDPTVIYNDQEKIYQSFIFNKFKIPHPKTFYFTEKNLLKNIKYPIVIKPLIGSKGKGITKTNHLTRPSATKFLQELLTNSYQDTRILVIGNKIIGAMQRTAKKGEWRSNYALGATIKPVKINNKQKQIALKSVKALNMDFAGIDILKDKKGKYYVLEVNRAPQFKGFVKATKINVAEIVADYLISIVSG